MRSLIGRRTLGAAAILAASLTLSLGVYLGFLGSLWIDEVAAWNARWTSLTLNLFGFSTTTDGTVLSSSSFAVNVVAECTAVGPLILFIGAVIAYPSPLRAKAIGVAIGILALSVINLVRITSLFWIGSRYPQHLDVAHLLVWQTATIVISIVMWLLWAERLADARAR